MTRMIAITALSSLALAFSSAALAQGYQYDQHSGLYLGAGVGTAELDSDTQDWLSDEGFSTDDTDTGYKFFVGYDFNANFSVEGSYVDLGEYTADITLTDGSNIANANVESSFDGFGIGFVARLPIQGGFGLHAKAGLLAWDGDAYALVRGNGQTIMTMRTGVDGTDPFYGLGAEFVIDRVMIRGEYERYDLSDEGEDFTIDLASLSLGYLF